MNKESAPKWILRHISIVLSALFLSLFALTHEYWLTDLPDHISHTISPLTNAQILIVLCLVLLIALTIIVNLVLLYFPKPNPKCYHFINPPGFYKHKKSGYYYCQFCLDGMEKLSPLYWENPAGLLCRLCGSNYKVSIPAGTLFSGLEQEMDKASAEIKANPEYQKLLKEARGEI